MEEISRKLFFIEPSSQQEATPDWLISYLEKSHGEFTKKLLVHGTVLFRGFNLSSAEDFSKCVKACNLGEYITYAGGTSPRKVLAEGVFTSTEAPPNFWIPPHNEMSYAKNFPKNLYFYCDIAAQQQGATPIADARIIYQQLDHALREKLSTEGLIYNRFYFEKSFKMQTLSKLNPAFMPWKRSFNTNDKGVVEEQLTKDGFSFEWLKNDRGLRTQIKLPAFREHPVTQEKVWFNQSNLFNDFTSVYFSSTFGPKFSWLFRDFLLNSKDLPCTTSFGSGEPFKKEEINHIIEVINRNLIIEPWRKGDFMVIDNYLNLHAREPFVGPRRIMASLTA